MSPESRPANARLAWLFPSVRDLVFIFLFWSLLSGPLSNRPLADADIGWHIRNGQQILAARAIPRADSFSSTMRGQPWIAWEWLYDVLLGVVYRPMGLNGVVLLASSIISLTFVLLLWQLIRRGAGLPLAIVLMLLAEGASAIHLFARPHIVSWLMVLLWFVALEHSEEGHDARRLIWFFPLSMLFWVNLHGGWLLGLALLAIYTIAAWVSSFRAADALARIREAQRFRAMLRTFVLSAFATLVNPYGWRLHAHIYHYLTNRELMDRIDEFRSPDFHGWAQRCFAIILVLTLVALIGSRRKLRLSHLLVVLLAAYSGLYASRNLPVSSMLLVLIIGPILWNYIVSLPQRPGTWSALRGAAARTSEFGARMDAQELRLRGHVWPAIAVIVAFAACLNGGRLGSRQLVNAHFDPQRLPVAAVDYLAGEQSEMPIFAPDSWGGYLIYRLYPQRLVVIDDRHDLYGWARINDYLQLVQVSPEWKDVLEKWQVRTALLPVNSSLANILREVPQEWRPVYEDKVAVVFERR